MPRFFRSSLLLAGLALVSAAEAETVWFVVGDTDGSRAESYLLPLSDPQHIADARARIAEGEDSGVGSIASVLIAEGGDGFNRNVLADGEPLWSWHVTEFEGFYDSSIELCDGWPGFIEEDVAAFIANTGGRVCFWGYSVVQELEQAPLFAVNEGLDGAWFDPAAPGQGVFIDVLRQHGQIALGWYSYVDGAPLGDGSQLWLTAQGEYVDDRAALRLYHSTGGRFGGDQPVQTDDIGDLLIEFQDCNHATLGYAFHAEETGLVTGMLELQRVASEPGCLR